MASTSGGSASGVHPFGAPWQNYVAGTNGSIRVPSIVPVPFGTSQIAYGRTYDPDSDPRLPPQCLTSISAMPQFNWPPNGPLSHEEMRLADYHAWLGLGVFGIMVPRQPSQQASLGGLPGLPQPMAVPPPSPSATQLPVSPVGPGVHPPSAVPQMEARCNGSEAPALTAAVTAPPAPAAGSSSTGPPPGTVGIQYSPTLDTFRREEPPSSPSYGYIMSISGMARYSGVYGQSHEELRWQDRQIGVRSRNTAPQPEAAAAMVAAAGPGSRPLSTLGVTFRPTLDTSPSEAPLTTSYGYIMSISGMPQYNGIHSQSHEELRWQDRQLGVRNLNTAPRAAPSQARASAPAEGTIPPHPPYSRTLDVDGSSYIVSISSMQPALPRSHEELRWADRQAGVRSIINIHHVYGGAAAASRASPGAAASAGGAGPSRPPRIPGAAAPPPAGAAPAATAAPAAAGPEASRIPQVRPSPASSVGLSPAAVPPPAATQFPAMSWAPAAAAQAPPAPALAAAAAPGPGPGPGPGRTKPALPAQQARAQSAQAVQQAQIAPTTPRAAQAAATAVRPSTPTSDVPSPPGAATESGSGSESLCCVCLDGRAEFGFVHPEAVHLCLCAACEADARRRNQLRRCFFCNTNAMFVTKVYGA